MLHSPSIIATPTYTEVESSFTELNDAIVAHSKWLTEWTGKIICGFSVEDQHTSEGLYRNCFFSQWYHGSHANFLKQKSEFISIKELHRMVHIRMHSIIKKASNGGPVTSIEYEHFIESETSFSKSLVNLRDELHNLLLSFDHLTGTLNRQAFFHILEQEYARVTRFGEPGCVVFLDIDNFKNINDTFGHIIGDKVLISIANFIVENMRPYDSICRYGGEEFLICMPKTTIELSHNIIDRIREELSQETMCMSNGNCIKVSASFGIASMSAEEKLEDTIHHADMALYQAKTGGRNKVGIWTRNN